MANVYVRSGAAGAADGSTWADAYLTLAAALTAKAAGDDFWVAADHAETQASAMTLTCPGTAATPCRIIVASHTGSTPPVAADMVSVPTATITTTGANTITQTGFGYWHGIIFTAGSGANAITPTFSNTAGNFNIFECCAFRIGATSTGNIQPCGASAAYTIWKNCSVQFGAVGQGIAVRARFDWRDTASAITGATIPNGLMNSGGGQVEVDNVDLSALSAKILVTVTSIINTEHIFRNCKFPATITKLSAAASPANASITCINCVNGGTIVGYEKHDYLGAQTTETTIVRTGGATDGTTPFSTKIVTGSAAKKYNPFEAAPISIWNDTSGSAITLTMEGIWGGGAVPNNDDIWMDVYYHGSASSPEKTKVSSGLATVLSTNSAIPAGSGTWGGSTTKFAMSVTFTAQQKGPVEILLRAGAASATFYVDPEPVISGVSIGRSFPMLGSILNELSVAGASTSGRVYGS